MVRPAKHSLKASAPVAIPESKTPAAPPPVPGASSAPSAPPVSIPIPAPPPSASGGPPSGGYGVTLGKIKTARELAREKALKQDEAAPRIEITPENLQANWVDIAKQLTADRALYQSAILMAKVYARGNEIIMEAGVVAHDFLKGERLTLLDFFKERYRNPEINVLFVLLEEKHEGGEKVLSLREVFDKMAAKNPVLRDLRDSLGMDLEY